MARQRVHFTFALNFHEEYFWGLAEDEWMHAGVPALGEAAYLGNELADGGGGAKPRALTLAEAQQDLD